MLRRRIARCPPQVGRRTNGAVACLAVWGAMHLIAGCATRVVRGRDSAASNGLGPSASMPTPDGSVLHRSAHERPAPAGIPSRSHPTLTEGDYPEGRVDMPWLLSASVVSLGDDTVYVGRDGTGRGYVVVTETSNMLCFYVGVKTPPALSTQHFAITASECHCVAYRDGLRAFLADGALLLMPSGRWILWEQCRDGPEGEPGLDTLEEPHQTDTKNDPTTD